MMADSTSHVEQDPPVGTQKSGGDEAFEWRRDQYLAMMFGEDKAFNESEAVALANSTQTEMTGGKNANSKKLMWTVPLSWQKVKKALDAGCEPATALEIFLTV